MPFRNLIHPFTLTGSGGVGGRAGGFVQYTKSVKISDLRHKATAKKLPICSYFYFYFLSFFLYYFFFFWRLLKKKLQNLFSYPYFIIRTLTSAFSHLHFPIRIFPSAFCDPHFVIRILSSACYYPPSAIRHHPVRILQRPIFGASSGFEPVAIAFAL